MNRLSLIDKIRKGVIICGISCGLLYAVNGFSSLVMAGGYSHVCTSYLEKKIEGRKMTEIDEQVYEEMRKRREYWTNNMKFPFYNEIFKTGFPSYILSKEG